MTSYLLLLAGAVILSLALYALFLTHKVKALKAEKVLTAKAQAEKRQLQKERLVKSLQLLAASVMAEDLNISEATIRCKILLDGLMLMPEQRAQYSVLDTVFDKIQHFATHQARKDLSKAERKAQDKARLAIENHHRAELMQCFDRLQGLSVGHLSVDS